MAGDEYFPKRPTFKGIYTNGSAWIRHLITTALTIVVIAVPGIWALSKTDSRAEQAWAQADQNEKEVDAIKENQGKIKTDIEVIKRDLKNEADKAETWRQETARDLDRILQKLDNERGDGR